MQSQGKNSQFFVHRVVDEIVSPLSECETPHYVDEDWPTWAKERAADLKSNKKIASSLTEQDLKASSLTEQDLKAANVGGGNREIRPASASPSRLTRISSVDGCDTRQFSNVPCRRGEGKASRKTRQQQKTDNPFGSATKKKYPNPFGSAKKRNSLIMPAVQSSMFRDTG
mmetsp:Transcript_3425/g.6337  ORF Transcript_3425/g.6337 Transcript_3425/m.6337 type:complete len:170 (+) Transcript_3425:52-561(+)